MKFHVPFRARPTRAPWSSIFCLLALTVLASCKSNVGGAPPLAPFPWPPPVASDRVTLPLNLGGPGLETAGQVDKRIVSALDSAGYVQRAYYAVPNGYAIVTRVEQIEKDGRTEPPPYRFSDEIPPPNSLTGYLSGLFASRPGYYRIIVFVVTNVSVDDKAPPMSEEDARRFLSGTAALPSTVAAQPLPPSTRITALIYEYQKSSADTKSTAVPIQSTVTAKVHLQQAGLWPLLSTP